MSIVLVHIDQHMIAINKQVGLLSVPGIGPDKQDCLASRVNEMFPAARIVHRLDRDTSGVIVMALDPDTHRELSRQFQDRETKKKYIAVVAGLVDEDSGEINLPIRKDVNPANKPRQIVDHDQGRPSITRYKVLDRLEDRTRLELQPITGRSHQLRLHLKEIGHPILGDDLYAPKDVLEMSDRLLLHAEYLMVTDPYTAAPVELYAECPF